jgi:hypothetical protein
MKSMVTDPSFPVAGQMSFTLEQMIDNFDNVFALNGPLAGYMPYITYGAPAPSQGLPSFQITHIQAGLLDNLYLRRGSLFPARYVSSRITNSSPH